MKKSAAFKKEFAIVRTQVNEWDPIGLMASGCPEDEYDCITQRLISLLHRFASDHEIQDWLQRFIPDHFGVALSADVATFLRGLRGSWSQQPAPGGRYEAS